MKHQDFWQRHGGLLINAFLLTVGIIGGWILLPYVVTLLKAPFHIGH